MRRKAILGALVLVPLMEAFALAQAPTADAKEGRLYLEGGLGFGVASMVHGATTSTGFDAVPEFGLGFAAEYGINEQFAVFTKLGVAIGLSDDPGFTAFGMTFDAAYKVVEKKGDAAALTAYAGLGFLNLDVDPKGVGSDSATDFVFELGLQGDFGPGDSWSLQPFAQMQLVAGSRPFDDYNGVLQIQFGVKLFLKLADNMFLIPSVTFSGGNFSDGVLFGVAFQIRL